MFRIVGLGENDCGLELVPETAISIEAWLMTGGTNPNESSDERLTCLAQNGIPLGIWNEGL